MRAPEIEVGILSGNEIPFTLNGIYSDEGRNVKISGEWKAQISDGKIMLTGGKRDIEVPDDILISPNDYKNSSIILPGVTIGVNFHWQRKEDQTFRGGLKIIIEDNTLTAVNRIPVEDYLISVISSEMSATSSEELLKTHSVISRSWLLAQINKSKDLLKSRKKYETFHKTDTEIIRWYDREDHRNFDVCADDHCQRYQGITRASTPEVERAVLATSGEVLTSQGAICDARFYKCCGGATEQFENVWEPVKHSYLLKVTDNPLPQEGYDHDLRKHEAAVKWIKGSPESFCNTSDKKVLSQILNDYDQETNDFYRWRVIYTQSELSKLIKGKTGIDFGEITDITPLERGTSGRIIRLKITGTKKVMIIGKELEIRKALSATHLYSSCFIVEKSVRNGVVIFTLLGAGWGHGVGLCQIGAAVMGSKGYTYKQILEHYFKGAKLERIY